MPRTARERTSTNVYHAVLRGVNKQPADPTYDANFWLRAATIDADVHVNKGVIGTGPVDPFVGLGADGDSDGGLRAEGLTS